ncbi:MAG: BlaI family penicillinase repressor [Pseudohongiellaceae bacterium]|jgi:BlaI family penicillinase repressor
MFQITDLQLDILRVLWEQGEATVAEVHGALPSHRDLASSTVATLLARLEKRELISHRTDGRRHVYRAVISEDQVRRSVLDTVTEGVFGGDIAAIVSHLLDASSVRPGDLDRVRQLLDEMESKGEQNHDA